MKFKKKLSILKDRLGNSYMGIKFDASEVYVIADVLKTHLGESYDLFANNRIARDGEKYHLTVLSVPEYQKVREKAVVYLGHSFDIELKAIGKGENKSNGNITYFVIAESEPLNSLVAQFGVLRDFHITLGFNTKDVFGVSKSMDSKILSF
jgi:hypothetical protein